MPNNSIDDNSITRKWFLISMHACLRKSENINYYIRKRNGSFLFSPRGLMVSFGTRSCDSDRSLIPRAEISDGSRFFKVYTVKGDFFGSKTIEMSWHWCSILRLRP